MASEAFAGSLCEGELGALLFFSIDAAVPDLGLVPRVMMIKDYIQNFFCVWKNKRMFEMAVRVSRGGWRPWLGQQTEAPVTVPV